MKSLAELAAIREKMKDKVSLREGAKPVLNTFVEEVAKAGLTNSVSVLQTGCIGICQYEPVVEVYKSGEEKVTYVHMTSEKALEVIEKHIKGGKAIAEYTMK